MKILDKAIINGRYTNNLSWERCKRVRAIPRWSNSPKNKRKILKVYIDAQYKNLNSKRTRYQVDHVCPLWSKDVCGLHVVENLQILSKTQNQNKSNSFLPYSEFPDGKRIYYQSLNPQPLKPIKIVKRKIGRANPTKKDPTKLRKKSLKGKSKLKAKR